MSRLYTIAKAALVAGGIAASSIAGYFLGYRRGYDKALIEGFLVGQEVQMEIIEDAIPGTKKRFEEILLDEARKERMEKLPELYINPNFEEWLKERSPDYEGGGLEDKTKELERRNPAPRRGIIIPVA